MNEALGFRMVPVSFLLFRVHSYVGVHYNTDRDARVVNIVYDTATA